MKQTGPTVIFQQNIDAWRDFSFVIQTLMDKYRPRAVCDLGGGANPVVPLTYLVAHQIEYTVLDASQEELAKAPEGYRKLQQDIEAAVLRGEDCFDFVFSKMLAEHLRSGRIFHRNVHRLLRPGGIAVHLFPTLYALPFVANKLAPQWLSSMLLDFFAPRERVRHAKFPAYYSWCYGPTPRMLRMIREIGFEIIEYRGLIGHIYFNRIPILRELHGLFSQFLVRHPSPYLTSFAQVVLRKPARA